MKLVSFALLAAVATLHAAPVPAQTVERWQKAAMLKYPALTQAGSPLNQRFLAVIAAKKQSDPAFFNEPDWPLRAADAAVEELKAAELAQKAKEVADKEKEKEDEAKFKKMSRGEREQIIAVRDREDKVAKWEKEWEAQKPKWVFDRLVFGDTEEVIVGKLNTSKIVTSRVAPSMRAELSLRYRWVLGESKFNLDFEFKDSALAAITFECLPEPVSEIDGLIHEDWNKLRAAVIEQFGPPTKSAAFPAAGKLRKSGLTVTDVWGQPGRSVALGLNEDGGKCNPLLRISDPARGVSSPGL